jgi:hypothetical protein
VTQRKILRLWACTELITYITGQARRHFHEKADQDDACSDAWERLELTAAGLSLAQYKKIAYRAINAKYKRWRRLQRREVRMA